MKKTFNYVVEGRGDFPVDMLRYDDCRFANMVEHEEAMRGPSKRMVRIASDTGRRPTVGRWESFGWKIVESDDWTDPLEKSIRLNIETATSVMLDLQNRRDRLAAVALNAILISNQPFRDLGGTVFEGSPIDINCVLAYQYADAMIKASKRKS